MERYGIGRDISVEETDDGCILSMTERETLMSATEMKQLGVVMLNSFGFCGLPGEHEDDPLKEITTYVARVQSELENWNVRAREDEEHPPYDKLTTMLEEALQRLRRLQEILNAKP